MRKRNLLFFLAVMLSVFPSLARDFQDEYKGQTLTYTVLDEDAKTVKTKDGEHHWAGCKVSGNLIIPNVVSDGADTYTVIKIGSYSFTANEDLTSVVIEGPGIETIEDNAFSRCSNLTSITLPEGLTQLGSGVFQGCTSLESVTLPDSLTELGEYAFFGCTSLKSVTIPEGLTQLGSSVFQGCTSLESITLPEGLTSLRYTFMGCTSLKSVTLPDSLTTLFGTFSGCTSLESITIPEGLTQLGSSVFQGCTSLKSLTLPESLTAIGKNAFQGCTALESIIIPDRVEGIEGYAFQGCTSLKSVKMPSYEVVRFFVGDFAFEGCTSLTSIDFSNVRESFIGISAFEGCTSLGSVKFSEGLNDYLFDDYVEIRGRAFYNCNRIKTLTLPNVDLGESAFEGCTSLNTVKMRAIFSIESRVFAGCPNLNYIYYDSGVREPISGNKDIFDEVTYEDATLFVKEEDVEKCKLIMPWKKFKTIAAYKFSNGVDEIEASLDPDAPYEIFTLDGVKIADSTDNLPAGIYIIRQGNAVKKIAVN
ncbi:MAG: leucine-rich repeat domain-containing protein [Bacteroidales bacterium]|nr:leucine-rich repeat domain-containing protein [Bacteroidales bacterium]